MTKKDLIQLIKDKADETNITDQSNLILERIKSIPQKEVIIPIPRKIWQLKPILIGSLSLVTTLIMVFLFISTLGEPPIEPFNVEIESYEDAIVLSSISSQSLSSLIETDSPLNMYLSYQLSSDPLVSNEIEALTKYLGIMEKVLSSDQENDGFNVKASQNALYQKSISFQSRDLTDQASTYQIDINTKALENDYFMLEGLLHIEDESYQIRMIGPKNDPSRLLYRLSLSENNYIEVTYLKQDHSISAQVEIHKNGMRQERIVMSKTLDGTNETVSIQFKNQLERGIYVFERDVENEKPIMRINYVIEDDEIERGVMIIRINEDRTSYDMEITPQGRPPIVVNPGRRNMPMRGQNQ